MEREGTDGAAIPSHRAPSQPRLQPVPEEPDDETVKDDDEVAGPAEVPPESTASSSSGPNKEGPLPALTPKEVKEQRKEQKRSMHPFSFDPKTGELSPVDLMGHSLLKAILKGGEVGKRGVAELHRRNHHLPGPQMLKILEKVNCPRDVTDSVLDIVMRCPICRNYEELPSRPNVSLEMASAVNELVWADLGF